jgi:hypothetical protein
MAISSPSSGLASSSQPSSTPPSLEPLLEELTNLAISEKAIQARRQELLDALDQLVEAGEAEEQLLWNDCKITRRTRKSYTYPQHILEQREQLKASERLSLALGEASVTIKHFWEVRTT